MKKVILILGIALSIVSCTKQTKIAYVDVEEIMKEYKGTKDSEAEMKVKTEKLKSELDSLYLTFQNKVNDYQQKAQKMAPSKRAQVEQVLMQEKQMNDQRQLAIQQQIQTENQESIKKLSQELKDFMQKYAKEKGYNFILGTSGIVGTVMYAEENADVTDDVLVQFNKSYKK